MSMKRNCLAGLWRVSVYWYWDGANKLRWVALPLVALAMVAIMIIPQLLSTTRAVFSSPLAAYRSMYGVYLLGAIPLVAIVQGASILHDDLEAGTLVYVWPKPLGRVPHVVVKWLIAALVVSVSGVVGVCILYFGCLGFTDLGLSNLLVMVWDWGGLVCGAVAYLSIGCMIAALFKKQAMQIQLSFFYVFILDAIPVLLPGIIKRFSVRTLAISLSSSQVRGNDGTSLFSIFSSVDYVPEKEAVVWLGAIVLVCLVVTLLMVKMRDSWVVRPSESA
jgi:hypothetical protein